MKIPKETISTINKNIKESEIFEVKSLVASIFENNITLTVSELKRIFNEELYIQVLSNKEVNDLIQPIKELIKYE